MCKCYINYLQSLYKIYNVHNNYAILLFPKLRMKYKKVYFYSLFNKLDIETFSCDFWDATFFLLQFVGQK